MGINNSYVTSISQTLFPAPQKVAEQSGPARGPSAKELLEDLLATTEDGNVVQEKIYSFLKKVCNTLSHPRVWTLRALALVLNVSQCRN